MPWGPGFLLQFDTCASSAMNRVALLQPAGASQTLLHYVSASVCAAVFFGSGGGHGISRCIGATGHAVSGAQLYQPAAHADTVATPPFPTQPGCAVCLVPPFGRTPTVLSSVRHVALPAIWLVPFPFRVQPMRG